MNGDLDECSVGERDADGTVETACSGHDLRRLVCLTWYIRF